MAECPDYLRHPDGSCVYDGSCRGDGNNYGTSGGGYSCGTGSGCCGYTGLSPYQDGICQDTILPNDPYGRRPTNAPTAPCAWYGEELSGTIGCTLPNTGLSEAPYYLPLCAVNTLGDATGLITVVQEETETTLINEIPPTSTPGTYYTSPGYTETSQSVDCRDFAIDEPTCNAGDNTIGSQLYIVSYNCFDVFDDEWTYINVDTTQYICQQPSGISTPGNGQCEYGEGGTPDCTRTEIRTTNKATAGCDEPAGFFWNDAAGQCLRPQCGEIAATVGQDCNTLTPNTLYTATHYCSQGYNNILPPANAVCCPVSTYWDGFSCRTSQVCNTPVVCPAAAPVSPPTPPNSYYSTAICVGQTAYGGSPGACCNVGMKDGVPNFYDYADASGNSGAPYFDIY
jgi:hypothetical protein